MKWRIAIKSCIFNVHAREAEENNRMSLGPKNSEVTTDIHEKSQWINLRIAAGMATGTHSMDDEHGWSERYEHTGQLGSGNPHS